MIFFKSISGQIQGKSLRQLVANFRNEYISNGIKETELKENPIDQFEVWFNEAVNNKLREPNAMHLATATPDGKPSGRVVLLKGFDEIGFIFYTNYSSRKSHELEANQYASLTFLWLELYKQVRVEGTVHRIPPIEANHYFNSRPRGSQISAWASMQSQPVNSRQELEKQMEDIEHQFSEKPVPRPDNWGGYCLTPTKIEFWLGRANRLHDRILYELQEDKSWTKQRLSP